MPTTIALSKFVGTISLGLLTGVSYTLSTQSLPSLLTLPSAKPAAYTIRQTARLSTLHVRTLSTISTVSLLLAFYLSPPRVRHPYLLWTSLMAATAGGLNMAMERGMGNKVQEDVEGEVNGEQVEKEARRQQLWSLCGWGSVGWGLLWVLWAYGGMAHEVVVMRDCE